MTKIYDKYGMNHNYDRVHPVFPHPTNVTKYILLTAGNVRIWENALVRILIIIYLTDHFSNWISVSSPSPPSQIKYLLVKQKSASLGPTPSSENAVILSALATLLEQNQASNSSQVRTNNTSPPNSPVDPGLQNIDDYLAFIGCDPPEVEHFGRILREKGFISYLTFASHNLSNDPLLEMGFSLGLVLRLRDNVARFSKHLKAT